MFEVDDFELAAIQAETAVVPLSRISCSRLSTPGIGCPARHADEITPLDEARSGHRPPAHRSSNLAPRKAGLAALRDGFASMSAAL